MRVQEKQQLLDFWRARQDNPRIKHAFLWKAYSTSDGMVKHDYVDIDLPNESRSGRKGKSKHGKQDRGKSKASRQKGKAKAVTLAASEEESDYEDDRGALMDDGDSSSPVKKVAQGPRGGKAMTSTRIRKATAVTPQTSEDEPASDDDLKTGNSQGERLSPGNSVREELKEDSATEIEDESADESADEDTEKINIEAARPGRAQRQQKGTEIEVHNSGKYQIVFCHLAVHFDALQIPGR
jgi:hypothetical protein